MPFYKLNVQIPELHSHRARSRNELLPVFGDTPTNLIQTEAIQTATGDGQGGHQVKQAGRVTKATPVSIFEAGTRPKRGLGLAGHVE